MNFRDLEPSTQIILKVILAVLILAFLWVVRDIILLLVLALILASAMEPMVHYFNEKQRIPKAVSVLTVYLLVFGLTGFVIYLIIPPAVSQFKILQENWPTYVSLFESRVGTEFLSNISFSDFIGHLLSTEGEGSFVSRTFGVFNGVLSVLTVLVISFYLVAEEKGMKQFVGTLVPERHQQFTISLIEKIQTKMGLWIIGQIILSFSIFVITYIGLLILRVPNALLLATLAGLLEIVPYIGPFLSAIPAVFFAFIISPALALATAIFYLLVQKTEGYVLVPKVMEKTVGTSPLAVLLALLIGFKLAGVVGLLIAVPLVGALTVVINEFWSGKPKAV